jgi:ABC-type multidrug transport system permease subunit
MVTFFKMTFRHTQLPLLVEGGAQVYDAMFDFLEMFLAVPIHVMVRFGKWTVRIETAPFFFAFAFSFRVSVCPKPV